MKEHHEESVRECVGKVMLERKGWATIEDILRRLDSESCWPAEFLASAADEAKKALIRRVIRQHKDSDGWPTIASVVTRNLEGETVRVYKQESLFDLDDYKQVVTYHHERSRYHARMRDGYRRRAREKFGVQLDLPFPAPVGK